MNKDNIKFTNPNSGETLIHKERADGKKDLFIIQPGTERKGHLVLNNGNVNYLRKPGGHVVADDSLP